ncbi:MAG: hypothetical protein KDB07_08635, partial [Planctomycetes bacterium]|nr:hypothetical protein [Planctomycetota bacterium]
MRNAIGLLVLALTLWLGACASDPHALPENAPAWVLNQDAKRPGILSGVGSAISSGDAAADNLAAEENAVNDILR